MLPLVKSLPKVYSRISGLFAELTFCLAARTKKQQRVTPELNLMSPHEDAKVADDDASPYLSRGDVADLVSQGRYVFLFDGCVLDVTAFAHHHPGGELVLRHAIGTDATDLITGYHPKSIIHGKLQRYVIGTLCETSAEKSHRLITVLPDGRSLAKHDAISQSYLQLGNMLETAGMFKPVPWGYLQDIIRCFAAFSCSILIIAFYPATWVSTLVAALLLAIFWHQAAFIAHDLGHCGVSHSNSRDFAVGILLADLLGGLSLGWWKSNHNVHHVVTNSPEHDPDIQHLPFFAVSERFFKIGGLYSSYKRRFLPWNIVSRWLVSHQHYLYYVLMMFGRFNLYIESWRYLLFDPSVRWRRFEISCMSAFVLWYSFLLTFLPSWSLRVLFIVVSHMATFLLHVQITLSHFAMPTEDYGPEEAFPLRQLRTSMDVKCPWWMDWIHGGLQFQVSHHLFPRLPKHRLRQATELIIKPWAIDHWHATWVEVGFVEGNVMVLQRLASLARQAWMHQFEDDRPDSQN